MKYAIPPQYLPIPSKRRSGLQMDQVTFVVAMIPEMQQLLKIYGEENDLYCVGTNEWISANSKYVKYISN
ncbi:hypothetical protein [Bacillus pseudomycoides]|uniref:hypothetical protein n=1 Tax=Bacillus pseudomycoides TaxID=64104 RepID=UPI0015D4B6D6|nr:hypothetical protein [Bacillus pseudomycoides]